MAAHHPFECSTWQPRWSMRTRPEPIFAARRYAGGMKTNIPAESKAAERCERIHSME
jgi:hypothetical protein